MRNARAGIAAFMAVVVLMFSVMMATTACTPRKVDIVNAPTPLAAEAVRNWYTATGALEVVANNSHNALQAIIQMNRAGTFPDGPAYAATMNSFMRIADAGLKASTILQKTPEMFGLEQQKTITEYLLLISTELQVITKTGLVGIKNPDSQRIVQEFIGLIQSSVNIIHTLNSVRR